MVLRSELDFDFCWNYGAGQCFYPFGMAFDIIATDSAGISLSAISLLLNKGANIQIEFWTKMGTHEGYQNTPIAWRHLSTSDPFNVESPETLVSIPVPPLEIEAGSTQAFYMVLTYEGSINDGGILCGTMPAPRVFEDYVEILSPARVFATADKFEDPGYAGYSL